MAKGPAVYYGESACWAIVGLYNHPGEPVRMERFSRNFGFSDSKDSLMALVIAKCRQPDFAQKWKGWRFFPALIDHQVYLQPNGHVRAEHLFKNEKELIKVVG